MLSLNQLAFRPNDKELFKISISLLPSAIVYIKGPNGCGKTTLLRMIAGICSPHDGNITIYDKNISDLAKPYCNYIGHNIGLKSEIRVIDYLKFWAQCYDASAAIGSAVHYFNLYDLLGKKCSELSRGNKKKVELAKLLTCPSRLWLLDEVESNLDETNLKLLQNLIITKANTGGIILLSSHMKKQIESAITIDMSDFAGSKLEKDPTL